MAFFPLPAPAYRGTGFGFASDSTYADQSVLTPNYATGKWVVGSLTNVDVTQLAPMAEAIEQLIQQDFAASLNDDHQRTIGASNGSVAFDVVLVQASDVPVSVTPGNQTAAFSYQKAASLAALIRYVTGTVAWSPA